MNYNLTHKQFDVLTLIERSAERLTQREIATQTGISIGSVCQTINFLNEQGFIKDMAVAEKGYAVLEPYRVKRAVFLAAGFGSRLMPITLNTPKPLVRVKGTRIIDTLLDAVVDAGIEEIFIVRGYLGEQFDQLLYKYPMIKFIENPAYNESNNISSAMCVRHLMQNAYVFEADLFLYNKDLIQKYQYASNYLAVPTEKTDDWCFETKNRVITDFNLGGCNCYHMFGISYWTTEDGTKLYEDLKAVYEMPGGKERFWDETALRYQKKHYKIEVRSCTFEDIIEIDSYSDLKKLDPAYC